MLGIHETQKFASVVLAALNTEAYVALALGDPCMKCRGELGVYSSWLGHTNRSQTKNPVIPAQAYSLLAELLSVYDEQHPALAFTPVSINNERPGGVSLDHFFAVVVSEHSAIRDQLCAILIVYNAVYQPLQVCSHHTPGTAQSIDVICNDPKRLLEFLSCSFGVEPSMSTPGSQEIGILWLIDENGGLISVTVACKQLQMAFA